MSTIISKIEDINNYNPYFDINSYFEDKYYENKFIEYLDNYKQSVEKLKVKLNHQKDKKIDKLFLDVIRKRNDDVIEGLILEHLEKTKGSNEENIKLLKEQVRVVKNMILVSETANMKRMINIDKKVNSAIDLVSSSFNVSNEEKLYSLLDSFKPDDNFTLSTYCSYVLSFKEKVDEVCNYYRSNYSVEMASKKINKLVNRFNKLLDINADNLSYYENALEEINLLVSKYENMEYGSGVYDYWIDEFRNDINLLKEMIMISFSKSMAKKLINILDRKTGNVFDDKAASFDIHSVDEKYLQEIFDSYNPSEINIFDIMFYSDEAERNNIKNEYQKMTLEEKKVFEMRIYEQYIRIFKGKIRNYNIRIRKIYSESMANKIVNSVNKRADKLIRDIAKEIGKPVPKNTWIVRKYLWADTTNFISDKGIKFRKFINPILRNVVRVAMNNKLIIEERGKLDSTKQYIFVSTHYFTEDVIGLFSSIGRQAYMLMGTTDQIENNPLMIAAACFGFFHVDRMDVVDRKECFEKQNKIIEHGTNFINYVSGSWETSENELQPLSFSGPYRTAKKMNIQIVPVASYLVKEKKEMYVRYGEPIDISCYDEETGNEIIRDTLASMHYKQISKYGIPIETINIDGYGMTHNLPYNQHIHYMDQIGNEYWNQPWSKPFAKEEIGVRSKKEIDEEDVYSFVDKLSRENLIKLSSIISEPILRRYERNDRYNIIKYIDNNYERFKDNNIKRKTRKK